MAEYHLEPTQEGYMSYSIHSLVAKGLAAMMALGLVGPAYALDCGRTMNQRDLNQCTYLDFQKED